MTMVIGVGLRQGVSRQDCAGRPGPVPAIQSVGQPAQPARVSPAMHRCAAAERPKSVYFQLKRLKSIA